MVRARTRAGPCTRDCHSGERCRDQLQLLFCAGGYYRYDEGYTPQFEGVERFPGPIVHPQHWPKDLDYEASGCS